LALALAQRKGSAKSESEVAQYVFSVLHCTVDALSLTIRYWQSMTSAMTRSTPMSSNFITLLLVQLWPHPVDKKIHIWEMW